MLVSSFFCRISFHSYTNFGESKKSGKYRCIKIPQKGQAGNGVCSVIGENACSKKVREGRWKKDAGASLEAHRAQQLQYHRGTPGHTCNQGHSKALNIIAAS